MKIVRQLDEAQWSEFVNSQENGNIFHTPEMFKVFSCTRNHFPELWAAVQDNGQILALFAPVQVVLFSNFFRSFTGRSIAYGGVLSDPSLVGNEGLLELVKTYLEQSALHCLYTEIRNLSNIDLVYTILQNNGFKFQPHLNFLIKLIIPPGVMFDRIGPRTRRHIRRGLRADEVKIEEAKDENDIKSCYDLLVKTYKAARVPLPDISLFEAAREFLASKEMIRYTLGKVDGVPVATSVDLLYKKCIYGWYGGVDRNYSRYRPSEIIMWDVLEWGAKNGYTVYDFGGAGSPNEHYGVRDFKAKFGGELVNFGRFTHIHALFRLKLSKICYQLLRGFL